MSTSVVLLESILLMIWSTQMKVPKREVLTPVLIDSMSSTCPPHPRTAMDQQRTRGVPLLVGELVVHDAGQLDQLDQVPCILRG